MSSTLSTFGHRLLTQVQGHGDDRQVNRGVYKHLAGYSAESGSSRVEEQTETFQTTAKEDFPGGMETAGARCPREQSYDITVKGTPKAWPDQCCLSGSRLDTEEVWVLGGLERRGVDDGRTMGNGFRRTPSEQGVIGR
jgi:hypothetical protein